MGKKSSSQTTGPSKQALPYLQGASNALNSGYQQSSQLANQAVGTLQGYLPQVLTQTMENPGLKAAGDYNQRVLRGDFLKGNPYLQSIIDNTSADVTDRVNSSIGTRGLAGGSAQTQLLARELARNESGLRYTDYNNQMGRMDNAVGQAAALSSAGNQNIGTLLAYLSGTAQLPQAVAGQYASGINGLWGDSKTTTGTPSTADSVKQGLGTALQLASLFSDRRLKRDIRLVGRLPDGLGVYDYRYAWSDDVERGVMADEVAVLRPWALGNERHGFQTVDYVAL